MQWTRSETIALAKNSCLQCHGVGLHFGKGGLLNPCGCVLRAIFRACLARFRYCATREKHISRISLEFFSQGRRRNLTWGLKNEEYMADFILVAKRTLDDLEYRLFRFHFLLGADWKLCSRRLKLDRGLFFHAVYRIEEKLGRAYRELEPYSLYPLDEYFNTSLEPAEPFERRRERRVMPVRPSVFNRSRQMLRSA